MVHVVLAAVLQASVVSSDASAYSEAYRVSQETGRPLVVLVGADWCPACVRMKQSVIPKVRKSGVLEKAAFVVINMDLDHDLARKLTRSSRIPQLIMFRKSAKGWARSQLTGAQSVETVENFINRGAEAAASVIVAQKKAASEEMQN